MKSVCLELLKKGSLISCCLLLLAGCIDEPQFSAPLIQTGPVTAITAGGVVVTGLVTYEGKGPAEIGFVWSTDVSPTVELSSQVVINDFSKGAISQSIDYDLVAGEEYNVRAFGRSGDQVIYGDVVTFVSRGGQAPGISSFSPASGPPGTIIEVHGTRFSGSPLHIIAKLNNIPVEVLTSSLNVLTVKVPLDFPVSGKAKLSVEVAGKTAVANDFFTLDGTAITDFTPHSVIGGDTLVITGSDFSTSLSDVNVMFGSEEATVISTNATTIVALVPYSLAGDSYSIHVTSDNVTATSASPLIVIDPWTVIPGTGLYPSGRERAISFSTDDGTDYYGLGSVNNNAAGLRHDMWKYNAPANTWTKLGDFPFEASSACFGFAIGSKGYVGLGFNEVDPYGNTFKAVWSYDAAQDKWTQKKNFPGAPRLWPINFVIGGMGYVGGGLPGLSDFWRYNPTDDTWQKLADFPTTGGPVLGSFAINGKGYAAWNNELWQYDPVGNSWTRISMLPGTMFNASAVCTGKRVYVFGGYYAGTLDEFWEYYPSSNAWVRRKNLPVHLINASSFVEGNIVYVAGGHNNSDFTYRTYMDGFLMFNPNP